MTQQEYENKIKELQDGLDQLKAAKIEAEQSKRWKPKGDEEYWGVDYNGFIFKNSCGNDGVDNWCYLTGNCFKTKKEAEEHRKQIEYTARYKNYIEEHSEPLDWKDGEQNKYYSAFDYEFNRIDLDFQTTYKIQGIVCASSKQIIWDAINEIGEDNFKKYVLEVK